eukprot:7387365-Prymnesium_polylepis.1
MTPVLTQSAFLEKGVLTPDEFVAAGDMLVLRCPTWQWQGGDPAKARPFLPSDKQFLITRNVPCQKRAATLGASCGEETDVYPEGDEGWVATIRNLDLTDSDAPRMTENSVPARDAASAAEAELDGMGVDLYDDDEVRAHTFTLAEA